MKDSSTSSTWLEIKLVSGYLASPWGSSPSSGSGESPQRRADVRRQYEEEQTSSVNCQGKTWNDTIPILLTINSWYRADPSISNLNLRIWIQIFSSPSASCWYLGVSYQTLDLLIVREIEKTGSLDQMNSLEPTKTKLFRCYRSGVQTD